MAGMFDDFCSDIHKQYKKTNDLIVADPHTTYTMIPTGSLEIDTEMNGGLAIVGRVVEVSGFESSGKTTLMSQSCVQALKMFPTKGVLYMDSEQSFDFTYAKSLGLEQNDRFKVFRPMNAEELDDVLTKAVAKLTSNISMIVIDSVASARTKAEITAVLGQSSQKGQHATFWGSFVLKLVMWASKYGIAIVLINQFRSKPSISQNDKFALSNTGIGNGESSVNSQLTTTGGFAVRFYCSARYVLKNISPLKEEVADKFSGEIEELRVANVCRIEAIKNKCYPPNKRVKYIIRFGTGTDDTPIIKDFLTKVGVIAVNGSMITYNGSIPELTFKENGKLRFNEHFTRPEFLEDAKKQFVTLKGTNYLENVVASNVDDIWDEGLGATDLIPSDTVEV